MHPIQRWIPRYISRCLGIREQEAYTVWEEITRWRETHSLLERATLHRHPPSILLPVAHILVIGWPGRDCIVLFSALARHYGIASLEYISQLMDGLDQEYEEILRKENPNQLGHQRFLALWMAAETANDVLANYAPTSLWEKQLVRSVVKKAEHLLKASWWKNEPFAYPIESELENIVRKSGV